MHPDRTGWGGCWCLHLGPSCRLAASRVQQTMGARGGQVYFPTPNRSEVVVIDWESPQNLPNREAIAAYQQGYSHMLNARWSSATAAFDEANRLQPDVASLHNARGTAQLTGQNQETFTINFTPVL